MLELTLTLPVNDIVESSLVGSLTLRQSQDQLFVVIRQNKLVKSMFTPSDFLDIANEESH